MINGYVDMWKVLKTVYTFSKTGIHCSFENHQTDQNAPYRTATFNMQKKTELVVTMVKRTWVLEVHLIYHLSCFASFSDIQNIQKHISFQKRFVTKSAIAQDLHLAIEDPGEDGDQSLAAKDLLRFHLSYHTYMRLIYDTYNLELYNWTICMCNPHCPKI